MKSKKQEYKELTDKDLRERLDAEQTELIRTKIYHTTTPLDNSGSIREKRRNIARIQTELRARELKKD
ncbi:MAG TPA: 50S ribosomal protein L29 [Petrimonas sp.]|uniref:50S ribosomal protein L29 n=1 Tax=Petrimonas sp. TaxID=2023866 RepID=UPI00095C1BC6|nr:50S ribosomal protein L29 [Petrimonas sp.]MEA5045896.1 50S ribosomal protein L29 [Petrimonas sp.]MEA5063666.1 50S ribosomal protein L29 [Petrimonas sp.]OJV35028.1 MAG: 50S ribosomal protein L29 [Bacteroidia bacterium 43-41]HHV85520.1 50S ribosomal protein L29 [Petrimonas sp.]